MNTSIATHTVSHRRLGASKSHSKRRSPVAHFAKPPMTCCKSLLVKRRLPKMPFVSLEVSEGKKSSITGRSNLAATSKLASRPARPWSERGSGGKRNQGVRYHRHRQAGQPLWAHEPNALPTSSRLHAWLHWPKLSSATNTNGGCAHAVIKHLCRFSGQGRAPYFACVHQPNRSFNRDVNASHRCPSTLALALHPPHGAASAG